MILPLLLQVAQPTALPVPSPDGPVIVVTGDRTVSQPLGSRIARSQGEDPGANGGQIASRTSMAGLTPQSGMDPFAGGTKRITKRTCRSDVAGMSQHALCALGSAGAALARGDRLAARADVQQVLDDPASTDSDRFFAYRLAWQIAEGSGDDVARTDALRGLVETGLLAPSEQVPALKSLAAAALASGDRATAIARLESLLALVPDQAIARGNLGVLYQQDGRIEEARALMVVAVQTLVAHGEEVPEGWAQFARR